jgi:hypothetical protein
MTSPVHDSETRQSVLGTAFWPASVRTPSFTANQGSATSHKWPRTTPPSMPPHNHPTLQKRKPRRPKHNAVC